MNEDEDEVKITTHTYLVEFVTERETNKYYRFIEIDKTKNYPENIKIIRDDYSNVAFEQKNVIRRSNIKFYYYPDELNHIKGQFLNILKLKGGRDWNENEFVMENNSLTPTVEKPFNDFIDIMNRYITDELKTDELKTDELKTDEKTDEKTEKLITAFDFLSNKENKIDKSSNSILLNNIGEILQEYQETFFSKRGLSSFRFYKLRHTVTEKFDKEEVKGYFKDNDYEKISNQVSLQKFRIDFIISVFTSSTGMIIAKKEIVDDELRMNANISLHNIKEQIKKLNSICTVVKFGEKILKFMMDNEKFEFISQEDYNILNSSGYIKKQINNVEVTEYYEKMKENEDVTENSGGRKRRGSKKMKRKNRKTTRSRRNA
jgi:hypothetical protein